ncbi:MAG: hypothetical protein A3H35_13015 [Betaproteobacteria bacterium RIFCSPLOWO2_02_FULL_62_17]|nr:MAG: hypothetical protein A3H35_13015 [Betaproteobacteria bacterium RIFCSPLOWO2_02_FULL_62_17]
MRALGSLAEDRKAEFMKDALRTLHEFQGAHSVRRPALPKAEYLAISRVGSLTARLIQAIKSAETSETATMVLRDAWLHLDHVSGETLGSPMRTLERLQQAAEFCLPEKKRADRAVEKSPASSLAIITLANHFQQHFGRRPTFGSGSPFLRFIREALPAYGLTVPSLAEIKTIAGRE